MEIENHKARILLNFTLPEAIEFQALLAKTVAQASRTQHSSESSSAYVRLPEELRRNMSKEATHAPGVLVINVSNRREIVADEVETAVKKLEKMKVKSDEDKLTVRQVIHRLTSRALRYLD